eukprot:gene11996-biopygen5356
MSGVPPAFMARLSRLRPGAPDPRAGRVPAARARPHALSHATRSRSPCFFRSPGVGAVMFALHPTLVFVPTELAATSRVPHRGQHTGKDGAPPLLSPQVGYLVSLVNLQRRSNNTDK